MQKLSLLIPFNRHIAAEVIPFAKEHNLGFEIHDFREASVFNDAENYKKVFAEVTELLRDVHCIKTLHAPYKNLTVFSEDAAIAEISKERILKAVDTAHKLQCSKIVVHTGFIPWIADDWAEKDTAKKIFNFFTPLALEYPDITICLENSFEDSFNLFEYIFTRQTPDNFKMCIDTGHTNLFGAQSTADIIERFIPHISHLHLHDNHGKYDKHNIPGSGTIDWASTSTVIAKIDTPTCLIEVFDFQTIKKNIKAIQSLLSL